MVFVFSWPFRLSQVLLLISELLLTIIGFRLKLNIFICVQGCIWLAFLSVYIVRYLDLGIRFKYQIRIPNVWITKQNKILQWFLNLHQLLFAVMALLPYHISFFCSYVFYSLVCKMSLMKTLPFHTVYILLYVFAAIFANTHKRDINSLTRKIVTYLLPLKRSKRATSNEFLLVCDEWKKPSKGSNFWYLMECC